MQHTRLFFIPMLCAGLIAGMVFMALAFSQATLTASPEVTVREVSLAAPPPPPPPPVKNPRQNQQSATNMQLTASGEGVAIQFSEPELDDQLEKATLPEVNLTPQTSALLDSLNVDWQALGLSDLDEMSRLLTQLKVKFPESLRRRGIRIADVELDVVIDQKGKVILRRIIHNEYGALEATIKKLVRQARFSIPKKNGEAVRAAFHWRLEFADS